MSKVVVGLSGGVDSAVTAALLREQGHELLGVHLQNWSDRRHLKGCANWSRDRRDAAQVAAKLGIPFTVLNFEHQYRSQVIEYFFNEYAAGRTPNPDILCNREIKFGLLLEWALAEGFDYLATGHYARVRHHPKKTQLLAGVDLSKDQSYFLSQLSQNQLRYACFPLGELTKREVRSIARRYQLPVAEKPDSQGLCFVGEVNLGSFLAERIPARTGRVVLAGGETVGEHHGAAYYTVGQRKGLGVAAGVPMYVLATDVMANTVTVGYDRDLYRREVATEAPHWLADQPTGTRFAVSIRYRMRPEPAVVEPAAGGLSITFAEPQRGPTPGQFAVLYDRDQVVGSAVIR